MLVVLTTSLVTVCWGGLLFLFYEFFGVVTNLFGGCWCTLGTQPYHEHWFGAQIVALAMLLVPVTRLTVVWVMAVRRCPVLPKI